MFARRIVFLNVLILLGIVAATFHFLSAWEEFEQGENVTAFVEAAHTGRSSIDLDVAAIPEEQLVHDFFVISERTLFSPERRPKDEEGEGEEEVEEAPEFPKRPEMKGSTFVRGELTAFLVVFENPKSQGESKTVRIGENVQGYTVDEITETTVSLRWNDVIEIINMMDASSGSAAPKRPQAQKLAAVNIISIGSRVAAVETTAPEAAEVDENQGLQVGVVGGQVGNRSRGVAGGTGALGSRGAASRGMNSGLGARGNMPSSMGIGGRSQGRTFPRSSRLPQ